MSQGGGRGTLGPTEQQLPRVAKEVRVLAVTSTEQWAGVQLGVPLEEATPSPEDKQAGQMLAPAQPAPGQLKGFSSSDQGGRAALASSHPGGQE